MDEKKFEALLIFLVPQVIQLIIKNESLNEMQASCEFYKSRVYELLEQEVTKMWHLSPLTLYNLYNEEKTTGSFEFPEET